jgi:anti-anti-sigma factor
MKLSLQSDNGEVVLIELAGQVIQKHISPFNEPLGELLGEDAYSRNVLIDMHDVESLDSSGVGWLLVCHKRIRENGGTLVLHSLSPVARSVLKVLNLYLVFKVRETEGEALSLVQGATR